jgi:hypothetical protein
MAPTTDAGVNPKSTQDKSQFNPIRSGLDDGLNYLFELFEENGWILLHVRNNFQMKTRAPVKTTRNLNADSDD